MKLARSVLAFFLAASAFAANDSVYAPLRLYDGNWRVTRTNAPAGSKPDELNNQCLAIGKYFACQQTVNGGVSALLIFVPSDKPGHFFTQSVNTQGRALGRGDLEITGNRWVFSSSWDQGGKTTYYQTINTFTGRDHIHFEQQESGNRTDWKTTSSGDDVRVGH